MKPLSWDHLDEDLTDRLETQRARIKELRDWWAPDVVPQHVLAGSVLAEAIIAAVAHDAEIELTDALVVLEEMAGSQDPRLTEAAGVSVVERLRSETRVLAAIAGKLGPKSRRLLEEQSGWNPGEVG